MRQRSRKFPGSFGVLLVVVISVYASGVTGRFLYGQRVPGLPTVNDRLQIDGEPEERWRRNVGDRIMFRCITGLKDYPIFVWLKDGKPLPRDVIKYQMISNGNSFLEIPRTSTASEGSYSCTVSNDFGVARKVFKLCVIGNAQFQGLRTLITHGTKEDCPGWWYNWSR